MKRFGWMMAMTVAALPCWAELVGQGAVSHVMMSSLSDAASVDRGVTLRYSPLDGASVTIAADGQPLRTADDDGTYVWRATTPGRHTLTHTVGETVWEQTVTVSACDDTLSIGEAVGAPDLSWTTSGDASWEGRQTVRASDGESAARSGLIGDGQTSVLSVILEGAGTLTFDWRASCEPRYDAVWLEVDGETVGQLTGETGWTNAVVKVGNGAHVVRWIYRKNRSAKAGEDAVWIDNVVWTSAARPTLAEALNGLLVWTTGGDADWEAYLDSASYEGGSCAVSGQIGDGGVSYVQTRVKGAGRLDFVWAVSCENNFDWFALFVDDRLVGALTGEQDWTAKHVDLGPGEHVLRWEYWKDECDEPGQTGADCAFLDYVRWTPEGSAPDPVLGTERLSEFCQWLKAHRQLSVDSNAYDAQALQASRATGKKMTLLQEYVAGTDPEDTDDVFTAKVELVDGVPVITWSPALNGEGVREGVRTYRIQGVEELGDVWQDVADPARTDARFFRVLVELP